MQKLKNAVTRFIADDEGAALAEYGILIAFIAIVAERAPRSFPLTINELRETRPSMSGELSFPRKVPLKASWPASYSP